MNIRNSMIALTILLFSNTLFAKFADSSNIASPRIVGGEDSFQGELDFVVALEIDEDQFCGGSLIASNWVLTAAHCVEGFIQPETVLIGTANLENTENAERFEIVEIIAHPYFNEDRELSHDFALLKISGHSSFPPIDINYDDVANLPTNMFTVAGWGAIFENSFDEQVILQKVDVPLVDSETCEQQIQAERPSFEKQIDDSMFCAGYAEGLQDACQGDSGGPIFYWNDTTQDYVLLGVVSWGIGCARPDLSGIYGNVSEVTDWIESEILISDVIVAGLHF